MAELPLAAASRRLRGLAPLPPPRLPPLDADDVELAKIRLRLERLEQKLGVPRPRPVNNALKPYIKTIIERRRAEVLAMIDQSQGFEFTGFDAKRLIGPLVYVLFRGERPLYVGMSAVGASRPLNPLHPVISQVEETDRLMIWPMPSAAEALHLEGLLISRLKPEFNRTRHTYESLRFKETRT